MPAAGGSADERARALGGQNRLLPDNNEKLNVQRHWKRMTKYPSFTKDPERFRAILRVLFEQDPVQICRPENPEGETEYDIEANAILGKMPGAASLEDVGRIVFEVFTHCFSEHTATQMVNRELLTEEIWRVWNESR